MDYCDIESARIAYKIFGTGKKTIVIDGCLGSSSAEWWHIAEALGDNYKVLVYDRPGYGRSSISSLTRTPHNIATELNSLLLNAGIEGKIILLGHSQGGLNVIEYTLMYPDKVEGIILLDPATPYDNEFSEVLTTDEFKKSGVDKTISYKLGLILTSLGLGFFLKPLLKKSPPFYYYKFSNKAEDYLLHSLCRRNSYKTSLEEYALAHENKNVESIISATKNTSLNKIPIKLLTHSSEIFIGELQYYGNLNYETANKIELLWQDIMKRYLSISNNTEHIIAPNSGHYIHLTDFELLRNLLETMNIKEK